MTDQIQHLDIDGDDFVNAPQALRDYAKKLKANYEALNSQTSTLRDEFAGYVLSDTLKEFKNPERVKRDLLADGVNPLDKESLNQWLNASAGDYARAEGTPTVQPDPQIPAEEIAQQQAMQSLGGNYRQPANMDKLEAAVSELGDNPTADQLLAAYRKHGI